MAATKMFFRSGFRYAGFSDLEDFWDNLPVFHHMILIFHSFKGFSDLEDFWDDYNALDDFQEV
ncbi:hypothetical protein F2Q70_00035296 [Brassica cretica]|uniref:Uncharacterized protein n=1 Tax=Brassica cretica TaxID=69181 RepID=A0A8S9JVK5_BRACR|nr:hypothetical protein F2Q70_00035296 [Brassica cretica]